MIKVSGSPFSTANMGDSEGSLVGNIIMDLSSFVTFMLISIFLDFLDEFFSDWYFSMETPNILCMMINDSPL